MCITKYNEIETMEFFKEEGREEGREEGIAIGEAKGAVRQLALFIKYGLITEEEAAKRANMRLDEFKKCEALYSEECTLLSIFGERKTHNIH